MRYCSRSLLVGFLLLTGIAGLSIVATGGVAAQQVDVAASDLDGSGTQENPYVITNASELQAMEDDLDAHYQLGSDIDASNTVRWNNGNGFDPIGDQFRNLSSPPAFTGSLDGNNKTVTRLTINRSDDNYVGLIGYIHSNGTVSDISIQNLTVTGSESVGGTVGFNEDGFIGNTTTTGTVTGSKQVGSLVGENLNGTILNAKATGSVTGSDRVGGLVGVSDGEIQNTTVMGTVSGSNLVGGVVGYNGGTIEKARATGNVTGTGWVGGLVGDNGGSIENAKATVGVNGGDYAGGLVGSNGGSIENAKATGNVTGSFVVGGIVGENGGLISDTFAVGLVSGDDVIGGLVGGSSSSGTVQDSYWDEQTTSQASSSGANATGLTTNQMTGQAAETNMSGLAFDSVWETPPDNYPVLRSQTTDGDNDSGDDDGDDPVAGFVDVDPSDLAGSGTESDPYVITNASELQAMEDDLDAHYQLGSDIDASHTAQWNNGKGFDPIGDALIEFNGSLNGNNHTLVGIGINRSSEQYVGLIGHASANVLINDILIKNITVSGSEYVGGFVGLNAGSIRNVTVTGNITASSDVGGLVGLNTGAIQNSTATGTITGSDNEVGGLVGDNRAPIRNVTAIGNVTGSSSTGGLVGRNSASIQNVAATGLVTGAGNYIGGLVGTNDGVIRDATSMGDVNSPADDVGGLIGKNDELIQNVTAIGSVDGSERVGGLVGDNNDELIQNATATGTVSGLSDVGGLVGYSSTGGTVQNATATGNVTGSNNDVGGLIGRNDGAIQIATATGSVTGSDYVGGLVGSNSDYGSIQSARATGNVTGSTQVGGFAGRNVWTIQNATATGTVTGTNEVGGLVGFNSLGGDPIRNSTATGNITGEKNVGGFIGSNYGPVKNIIATGSVIGSKDDVGGLVGDNKYPIRNATATGTVTSSGNKVGGLVGNNDALIQNVTATGAVTGSDSENVGGLVGANDGSVQNARAIGSVIGTLRVGGLVGNNGGWINDTFAVGSVTGVDEIGGLVGIQSSGGSIQDSYWDEQTTGQSTSAGANATGLTTAKMTGQAAETNMTGLDFESVWQTQSYDYPVLRLQTSDDGGGASGGGTSNATATVTGEDVTVVPGENATIEFNVTNTGDVDSRYILNLSLPEELTAVSYTNASGERQDNESKWAFKTISPGETVTPTVTVQTPPNSTGTYAIDATVLTDADVVATTEISVTAGTVSVPEAIDADNNNEIGDMEILTAIEYWQTREPVPQTDGERIGDFEILELVEQWRSNSVI